MAASRWEETGQQNNESEQVAAKILKDYLKDEIVENEILKSSTGLNLTRCNVSLRPLLY